MLFEEVLEQDEFYEVLNGLIFDFVDSLDMETLTEEQSELLDDLLTFISEDKPDTEEDLEEAVKKRVVRAGKFVRKLQCKPGYKAMGNRCVKMSASEKKMLKKRAKKSARKRKSKKNIIAAHRKRSMRMANK